MRDLLIAAAGWAAGVASGGIAVIVLAAFSLPDLKPIDVLEPPSHD